MQIMHNSSFYAQFQLSTRWVVIIVITYVITLIFQYIRPSKSHRVNFNWDYVRKFFKLSPDSAKNVRIFNWKHVYNSHDALITLKTTEDVLKSHDDLKKYTVFNNILKSAATRWFLKSVATYWFVICSNKKIFKWKYGTHARCQRSLYCVRSTSFHVYHDVIERVCVLNAQCRTSLVYVNSSDKRRAQFDGAWLTENTTLTIELHFPIWTFFFRYTIKCSLEYSR